MSKEIFKYKQGKNPNSRNGFKKGHLDLVPQEARKRAAIKISKAHKGMKKPWAGIYIRTEKTKKRLSELSKLGIIGMKGRKHSKATKLKMSKNHKLSDEQRKAISKRMKGRKLSKEHKKKISQRMLGRPNKSITGARHPNWKGGVTPLYKKIRDSIEYQLWRKLVFERDNYICQECGQRGGKLNADHIKPFADYPKLRFVINNGRTLCESCHRKTDTWGFKLIHNRT